MSLRRAVSAVIPPAILDRYRAWRYAERRSYQEIAADNANQIHPISGARVLVVGANTGEDCKLFIDRGAAEVHGLDVIKDIGTNYAHPRVHYHRRSIEQSGLDAGQFDLVFAVATMEHVPNIKAGFQEMARLVAPGGSIYAHSAPLWFSPFGHHMGCFNDHPWVHVVFSREEIIAYAARYGISGFNGHDMDFVACYMMNRDNFNMLPSSAFLSACSNLGGMEIVRNDLALESQTLLEHELGQKALALGHAETDLLASGHTFIGKKP